MRWVCESGRPFKIIEDAKLKYLMKTGRPGLYVPSEFTVSRDVKEVFKNCKNCIGKLLAVG